MHFSLNRFEQGGFHALEMTEDPVSKWGGDLWKPQTQKRAKIRGAEAVENVKFFRFRHFSPVGLWQKGIRFAKIFPVYLIVLFFLKNVFF